MKIELININDIKGYERNNKIHTDEQIEQIARSIRKF
jgi:ParB-like chromosome segregation protein Spo0J